MPRHRFSTPQPESLLMTSISEPIFSLTTAGPLQTCLSGGLTLVGMLDGGWACAITESRAGLVIPAGDP